MSGAPSHRRLEVADRGERLASVGGRLGIERVVLALERRALARVRPAGVALPHEPARAGRARGRDQVVGALGAQPVGHGERLVEVARHAEPGQRGELVHDDVRPGGDDRVAHRGRVQRVDDDRLGAERAQLVDPRAGGAGDVVAARDQLRNQAAAQGARGTRDEDA